MFITLSPARGGDFGGGGAAVSGGDIGLALVMGGVKGAGGGFGAGEGGNSKDVGTFFGTAGVAGVGVRGGMIMRDSGTGEICGLGGPPWFTGFRGASVGRGVEGEGGGFGDCGTDCIDGDGLGPGGLLPGRVGLPGTTTGLTRCSFLGPVNPCSARWSDATAGLAGDAGALACDGGLAANDVEGCAVALGVGLDV
jgi:hypothetical protein